MKGNILEFLPRIKFANSEPQKREKVFMTKTSEAFGSQLS